MPSSNLADRLLPGLKWLRGYSKQAAIADLIAGITVGLTVLPQGLAYATLAGLEPQYGLYSAFVGGIIYALLGSCRQVTIGPTALLALMTSRHTGFGLNSGPAYAVLLCLASGIVELLMAILRLGVLVDLISLPVTVGFTSATAVIIATSQLKGLLGIRGQSESGFFSAITFIFNNLNKARIGDLSMGIIATISLLLLRKLKDLRIQRGNKFLSNTLWLISTGRNALIVVFSSIIAYFLCTESGNCPFILTGTVRSGLPSFGLPLFETEILGQNGTSIKQNFSDMFHELGSSMIVLPVIAVLGNVAISKAFGDAELSPSRELVALSLSNICGSLFSSIPVTGSFSRSAVNHASGVRTPIGGVYTTILVLLAMGILTPCFQYIPKAALSAVIVSAVIFMIEFEVIKPLWRCSRRELFPGAVTFLVSLVLNVEFGLLLGVGADVAFLVYRAARPGLNVVKLKTENGFDYILMRPKHSSLYFPAIEWMRTVVSKAVADNGTAPMVLDFTNVYGFDFTAARGIGALYKYLSDMHVPLFLMQVSRHIAVILKESTNIEFQIIDNTSQLGDILHEKNISNNSNELSIPLISQIHSKH